MVLLGLTLWRGFFNFKVWVYGSLGRASFFWGGPRSERSNPGVQKRIGTLKTSVCLSVASASLENCGSKTGTPISSKLPSWSPSSPTILSRTFETSQRLTVIEWPRRKRCGTNSLILAETGSFLFSKGTRSGSMAGPALKLKQRDFTSWTDHDSLWVCKGCHGSNDFRLF